MKSNGYGSFVQNILVHVDREHAEPVASKLGIEPFKEVGEPLRVYFAWTRLTTRPGNDEDVVWDLSVLLGVVSDRFSWQIDWDASDY